MLEKFRRNPEVKTAETLIKRLVEEVLPAVTKRWEKRGGFDALFQAIEQHETAMLNRKILEADLEERDELSEGGLTIADGHTHPLFHEVFNAFLALPEQDRNLLLEHESGDITNLVNGILVPKVQEQIVKKLRV